MAEYTHKSKYFYGNEISKYGLENNYVDYATLSKSFSHVLVNDITKLFYSVIDGEYNEPYLVNGYDYNEYDEPIDIFQYYIISYSGFEILKELTDEIIYYLPVLNCYIWGVTHFGTSWDYVLTDIKLDLAWLLMLWYIAFILVMVTCCTIQKNKNNVVYDPPDNSSKINDLKNKLELVELQIDSLDNLLLLINEQLDYTLNDNKKSLLLAKKVSTIAKLEKLNDKQTKIINTLKDLE